MTGLVDRQTGSGGCGPWLCDWEKGPLHGTMVKVKIGHCVMGGLCLWGECLMVMVGICVTLPSKQFIRRCETTDVLNMNVRHEVHQCWVVCVRTSVRVYASVAISARGLMISRDGERGTVC